MSQNGGSNGGGGGGAPWSALPSAGSGAYEALPAQILKRARAQPLVPRVTADSDMDDENLLRRGSAAFEANHWARFFSRTTDFQAARCNHVYTSEERRKMSAFESIDYLPPNSKCYRMWLKDQVHRRQWDRWLMMFCIGVSVAFVGYLMYTLIEILSSFRYDVARWVLANYGVVPSWLFSVTVSCLLVFFASAIVVHVAPAAGGSGVPECMAFLNGIQVPKFFNIYTLIVKFLSCATAVGAGMPIGPEGPMLHIGAIVGAGLSQGESTTLGYKSNFFKRFRNSRDKRDFVTAGVAIGVAVAFAAPIGGLLFAFEEIASYWTVSLSWQIFFGTMSAFLSLSFFKSAEAAVLENVPLGLFDGSSSIITFEIQSQITAHALSLLPAIVIGMVCGGLAIIFTVFNVKVARLRQVLAPVDKPWNRMLEPVMLMFVYTTLSTFLPLFFSCNPTGCFVDQSTDDIVCPPGISSNVMKIVETDVQLYTCQDNSIWSDIPFEDFGNVTGPTNYNELATLMSVTGEEAIHHLFTRRTHLEFGWASVTTMLVVYFLLAAIAAGSAISAGLFVPMLVIGSCAGRLVGLAATHAIMSYGYEMPTSVDDFTSDSPWTWLDPGAFALVGAGAFMGGVTRLTVSLSVIMMEISNDIRMLPSVLVAILVAKSMADMCTHSLYHSLMEEVERVNYVKTIVRDHSHGAYPVVRSTPNGQVFVGTIGRDHLKVLLRHLTQLPVGCTLDVTYEDLQARQVSKAERATVADQELALLHDIPLRSNASAPNGDESPDVGSDGVRQRGHSNSMSTLQRSLEEGVIDLRPYINVSAVSVLDTFSVERAYMMFRTQGVRHMAVVDASNHVVGIIARQDLIGYRLDDAFNKAQRRGDL